MYRFKDDLEWGELLRRFRNGTPSQDDFHKINQRVVDPILHCTKDGDELPSSIAYATPNNKERDAINSAIFQKKIQTCPDDAIAIFASEVSIKMTKNKRGKYERVRNPDIFWKHCTENDCNPSGTISRFDPMLKLYKNCPVMLVSNESVENNKANGTTGTLKRIFLKRNATIHTVRIDNVLVKGVLASDVAKLDIELQQSMNTRENIISIEPKLQTNIKTKFPKPFDMQTTKGKHFIYDVSAYQLPLVVNHATTGHKLQGCTKSSLFVNCFSYNTNWPYVVLSRVKTIKGLFLRKPLDPKKDYSVHCDLFKMLRDFRNYKLVPDSILQI